MKKNNTATHNSSLASKPLVTGMCFKGAAVLRHGSLFSGIGGFDLAAEWMGWQNIFHCEWNKYGQKLLKHHFPKSISYGDITKTDFTIHRGNIDILTGGFPCQPYSQAGKRKGTNDNRHLWPEMLRAIREIQPGYIVGENVRGLTNWNRGLVFDQVQAEMEAQGYEVLPFLLPACAVNALHRRDRIWFVAYSDVAWQRRNERKEENESNVISDTNISRSQECWNEWITPKKFTHDNGFTFKPGIRRGDDGFSGRVDRLKGLGNAIVPQVAYEIFKCVGLLAAAPLKHCQ